MYTGLLHLHNLLRWIILILLLIALVQSFSAKNSTDQKSLQRVSLFLLISAHLTLVIGLYQWFAGPWGWKLIRDVGFSAVMKNPAERFWAVEHITGMLFGIILITVARRRVKTRRYSAASWLYLVALIIILLVIPWPFREGIGRPLLPGMK